MSRSGSWNGKAILAGADTLVATPSVTLERPTTAHLERGSTLDWLPVFGPKWGSPGRRAERVNCANETAISTYDPVAPSQYRFRQIRSTADAPLSPTIVDSDQARAKRNSTVRNVRSGLCPGAGSPRAWVTRAATRGVSCTTSSGRGAPVLVSMRAETSRSVTFASARFRP